MHNNNNTKLLKSQYNEDLNADKSDERLFKIEQERNNIQKDIINKNDTHRIRIFWASFLYYMFSNILLLLWQK